jgi:hypothetical protein
MDARRDTRPGLPAMVEQLTCAGCHDIRELGEPGHDWLVCTSPRGSTLTLSWDDARGALTLVRYLTTRDGATIVGRFRVLSSAADAAATL